MKVSGGPPLALVVTPTPLSRFWGLKLFHTPLKRIILSLEFEDPIDLIMVSSLSTKINVNKYIF